MTDDRDVDAIIDANLTILLRDAGVDEAFYSGGIAWWREMAKLQVADDNTVVDENGVPLARRFEAWAAEGDGARFVFAASGRKQMVTTSSGSGRFAAALRALH